MAESVYRIGPLPPGSLDAATLFHHDHLPELEKLFAGAIGSVVVVFPVADYTHKAWRRAAIAELARLHAPARINAVVGEESRSLSDVIAYLHAAPGVTGQLLALDGNMSDSQA